MKNIKTQPKELFSGVIEDIKTIEQTAKTGWNIDEVLAGSAPFSWEKKSIDKLKNYPIWNQYMTSACVAFSKAKQVSIAVFKETGVWIDFSPASIYQLRSNDGAGMFVPEANEIVNSRGVTLEALMKSQNLTEKEIAKVKRSKVADLIAKAIAEAVVSYLYITDRSIDRIAQTIESGRGVSLLIFATADEYTDTPTVKNKDLKYEQATIRHEVVATDYFIHETYGKVLWIDDSWGVGHGQGGHRIMTEDFLNRRCIFADAIDLFSFEGSENKPKFDFAVNMRFGQTSEDIKKLQDMLKYEQELPSNQPSTGYYGYMTASAVLSWQKKNKVDTDIELDLSGGRSFGPRSRKVANEKFA